MQKSHLKVAKCMVEQCEYCWSSLTGHKSGVSYHM